MTMRAIAVPAVRLVAIPLLLTACAVAGRLPSALAAPEAQQTFATPEEAAEMLTAAFKAGDTQAMLRILGARAEPLIDSGDEVADRNAWARFAELYDEAHTLVKGDGKTVLQIGAGTWPFPIPLIERDGRWSFDTDAGEEEILDRRIGRNELSAMQVVLAVVDAQREYYLRNPQQAKLAQYAQLLASTAGKRDGLYWPVKEGEPVSPLGEEVARARGEGYKKAGTGAGEPYHGYYYRMLKGQGPSAPGGAYDYVVRGAMIGGFALVAYPAEYDNSGVMTFLVNHDGVVYEKDLGPDGAKEARAMTLFNPDATWKTVTPPAP